MDYSSDFRLLIDAPIARHQVTEVGVYFDNAYLSLLYIMLTRM